jgi:hypothetical protein
MFFLIGIIGLVMFLIGGKMLIEKYKSKIIGELKLTDNWNEINFEKIGLYSVCVVGGGYANNLGNFEAKITNNENEIEMVEKRMKFKFHHKGKLATEFYQFAIENPGIYKLIFKGSEDLEVKESMLVSKRLFQKKLPMDQIGILIKETSSGSKFIIGLLMTIFGFNIAGLGVILAFNPQLFL